MGRRGVWRRVTGRRPQAAVDWPELLATSLPAWPTLLPDEQERLVALVEHFVDRVRFEAARGFELHDRHRAVIAGQACRLLLGLDLDEFPWVRSVIVHRSTVVLRGRRTVGAGRVETTAAQTLDGQAHHRGPVVLSWSAVRADLRMPARGRDVILHEFAHQLDMIDGVVDGTPPIEDELALARWVEVCTDAYERLRGERPPSGDPDRPTVLRSYGGTNAGEFFAVATEAFFLRPGEFAMGEPALYRELAAFYGQDPAARAALRDDAVPVGCQREESP